MTDMHVLNAHAPTSRLLCSKLKPVPGNKAFKNLKALEQKTM